MEVEDQCRYTYPYRGRAYCESRQN